MRACVRRERTCSTPCARPVSDPARRRRRTVVGRPPVVGRVHWTWMHWDARRGPWCVRARERRDDSTDGIPLLYSFPRSYTRWRRITRYARLAPRTSPRRRSACKRDVFSTRSVIYTRARRVERISASTRARPRPASTRARPCPDGCASATTRSTPSSENLS